MVKDVGHTRIRVTTKLTDKLNDIGKKKESYEDVIWRLLKEAKYDE